MIFNIQRYSTHDGEGIRTIIFYKGCPLSCLWCCNPESQAAGCEVMFNESLCRGFGECFGHGGVTESPDGKPVVNRNTETDLSQLVNACPSLALTVVGEDISVAGIISEIEKDLPFYAGSKGGVTLSGGEPLAQGDELVSLLSELKQRGIDVAIETSLHVPWEKIERVLYLTNTFLADLKHTEDARFYEFTGGDLRLVLENIQRLCNRHSGVTVRIPVIPSFNDSVEEMQKIIRYAATLKGVKEIHFLPYHPLGECKYRMLGKEYRFRGVEQVDHERLVGYVSFAKSLGLNAITGG